MACCSWLGCNLLGIYNIKHPVLAFYLLPSYSCLRPLATRPTTLTCHLSHCHTYCHTTPLPFFHTTPRPHAPATALQHHSPHAHLEYTPHTPQHTTAHGRQDRTGSLLVHSLPSMPPAPRCYTCLHPSAFPLFTFLTTASTVFHTPHTLYTLHTPLHCTGSLVEAGKGPFPAHLPPTWELQHLAKHFALPVASTFAFLWGCLEGSPPSFPSRASTSFCLLHPPLTTRAGLRCCCFTSSPGSALLPSTFSRRQAGLRGHSATLATKTGMDAHAGLHTLTFLPSLNTPPHTTATAAARLLRLPSALPLIIASASSCLSHILCTLMAELPPGYVLMVCCCAPFRSHLPLFGSH